MATATKICRVCGKEYEACHTLRRTAGVFRWQEVACSPECGAIYLAKIEESRRIKPDKIEEIKVADIEETIVEEVLSYDDDDDNEEFDEDEYDDYFDDEE